MKVGHQVALLGNNRPRTLRKGLGRHLAAHAEQLAQKLLARVRRAAAPCRDTDHGRNDRLRQSPEFRIQGRQARQRTRAQRRLHARQGMRGRGGRGRTRQVELSALPSIQPGQGQSDDQHKEEELEKTFHVRAKFCLKSSRGATRPRAASPTDRRPTPAPDRAPRPLPPPSSSAPGVSPDRKCNI